MFENLNNNPKTQTDENKKKDAPSASKQNKGAFSKLPSNDSSNKTSEPIDEIQPDVGPVQSIEDRQPSNNKLKLIHIAEMLDKPIQANWLIDGHLTESSLAFMFGNPANGKSFIALDMAFCIAHGIDWHGHSVKQGTVVYIAGEGFAGLQKRVQALCIKYGIEKPDNFYASNQAIDLNSEDSMNELANEFPEGCNIELIVIDTLNRNCSADENSAKEMSKVIHHCDILKDNLGASVLVVHHSGHSSDDRVRGSSSIKGAIDVELRVSKKDVDITLTNTKMKDFDEFDPISFDLQSVEVGLTDDGEPITSAILTSKAFKPEAPVCSNKEIKLLDSLRDLLVSDGLPVAANDEFFDSDKELVKLDSIHQKVSRKDWFNHCQNEIEVNSKVDPSEAKRKAFDRSVRKLLNAGRVASNDDNFFVVLEPTDLES